MFVTIMIVQSEIAMTTSVPLDQIKVLLLENIHPTAENYFREQGFNVTRLKHALSEDELIEQASDVHLIGVRSKTHLTARFLKGAKRLWGIGCFCIGTNQVDLKCASQLGIPVFNSPFQNTRSVAELVISESIALHRKLFDKSHRMHRGQWEKSAVGAHEIRGKTMGIVGYGRIGSQVSVLAEAMGMSVIYHDIVDVLPMGNAQPADSLESLLRTSDVVTLHVPATHDTENMIGPDEIAAMKEGAYLLNNARGNVVDIDALADALRSGHLAGAAVDVFPKEPASNQESFSSPLQELENVILTPHIGGSTVEAQISIAQSASSRLVKLMNNGTTATAVNVPEVQLPRLRRDHHRLIHFHQNKPGVLSKLHRIIGDLGINITAEFLQSDPEFSYLIIDLSPSPHEVKLKEAILAMDETIRVRFLW